MQNQYWITKQTLSQKFGRKEDDCIIASDAELDTKLELLRNIQISCTLIQKVLDKYQESICYLSQEINSMGRFLKENSNEDRSQVGKVMLPIGKSLIFCAQQQLALHEPLIRFHQELETFRQRAISDTLQNILAMERARTEYRAALSWMKNISRQLDPDTSKQLEKFKKVQSQVRRGKTTFDKLALDCVQKVDLLAAARCNMLNQTLSYYHNKLLQYIEKTARMFLNISENLVLNPSGKSLLDIQAIMKGHHIVNNSTEKELYKGLSFTTEKENVNDVTTNIHIRESEDAVDDLNSNDTKVLMQLELGKNSSSPGSLSFIDHKNELEKILLDQSNCEEVSGINFSSENANQFLPSSLLLDSLKKLTQESKADIRTLTKDETNVCQTNEIHGTKSWMELFQELDPLMNQTEEKLSHHKNSC